MRPSRPHLPDSPLRPLLVVLKCCEPNLPLPGVGDPPPTAHQLPVPHNDTHFCPQVYDSSATNESQGPAGVRVKASQCFTKYKWRNAADTAPGQPAIVATQVGACVYFVQGARGPSAPTPPPAPFSSLHPQASVGLLALMFLQHRTPITVPTFKRQQRWGR